MEEWFFCRHGRTNSAITMSSTVALGTLGGTSGSDFVTRSFFSLTGMVRFVDSTSGDDTAPGTRLTPWATLAYAVTQVTGAYGSVIVLLPGYDETISTAITVPVGISIVGEGTGAEKPVLRIRNNTRSLLLPNTSNIIDNIDFDDNTIPAATSGAHIEVTGTGVEIRNCSFSRTSLLSSGPYIKVTSAGMVMVVGCTFLDVTGSYAVISGTADLLHTEDCVFDQCIAALPTDGIVRMFNMKMVNGAKINAALATRTGALIINDTSTGANPGHIY